MALKITVVTATRNRRELLRRCLESVASQSHAEREHVVVDGASTDGTPELLADAACRDPLLRFVSEPDHGLSHALNKGLALARGDVIGVLGDDDAYEPGALVAVAEAFERQPEACLVSGNCHFVTTEGAVRFTQSASFTGWRDLVECWRHWGTRVCLPAASTFIARRALDAAGGFDERDRYAMDYGHWVRLTARFPEVVTLDRVLARFRYDEGTISHAPTPDQWQETLRISREHWGEPMSLGYWRFRLSYLWHYRRRVVIGGWRKGWAALFP